MAIDELNPDSPAEDSNFSDEDSRWIAENLSVIRECLINGVSGSFTTVDSKTVTVTNGIITGIV